MRIVDFVSSCRFSSAAAEEGKSLKKVSCDDGLVLLNLQCLLFTHFTVISAGDTTTWVATKDMSPVSLYVVLLCFYNLTNPLQTNKGSYTLLLLARAPLRITCARD